MQLTLRRTKIDGISAASLTNDELDDNFSFLSNEINSLSLKSLSVDSSITGILTKLDEHTADIVDVNEEIAQLKLIDISLTQDIGVVNNNIGVINSDLSSIHDSISSLTNITDDIINRTFTNTDNKLTVTTLVNGVPGDIVINASSLLVDTTSSQTLSNKTFSGVNNTFNNIPITAITGILPVTKGGTNADNIINARTNLGLEIGKDVQSYNSKTVISDTATTFTNTFSIPANYFILTSGDNKNLTFNISTNSLTSPQTLTLPYKSGTIATLDDINTFGSLTNSDIGVKVLAFNTNVVYSNLSNYFYTNESIQYFKDRNLKITDDLRLNTQARFDLAEVAENSQVVLNIPPDNGTIATKEYVQALLSSGIISGFNNSSSQHILPGGLIMQWGSSIISQTKHSCSLNPRETYHNHSVTYGSIIFKNAFPHTCFVVIPVPRDYSSNYIDGCEMAIGLISKSNTGFSFLVNRVTGCTNTIETNMYVDYLAIGY